MILQKASYKISVISDCITSYDKTKIDEILVLGYMDFAVPDGEAEYNAMYNYMWKDAVEVTKTHQAHMMVTILGEGTAEQKGILYAKAIATLCKYENTIGVYANEVVYFPYPCLLLI